MQRILLLPALIFLLSACTLSESQIEKKAARIHQAALTVDSHTDTPIRLTRDDYDFGVRNDSRETRGKIDLPRMKEGGMDGIWFAVWLGQGPRNPEANERAKNRTGEILEVIYRTVEQFPDELELATRAGDLAEISGKGKHAIYIGLENGYPIGTDVNLLDTFYNQGVRYVTLCHTANNDICDSSTDSLEHGGLSNFGGEVVERMNDLGMLIDLSHASDEAFYDVMERSRVPVIASHSCARALCNHPRNLDDDMLFSLKENGGVIQLCLVSEYLQVPRPNPARDSAKEAVREKHGSYYELDESEREAFVRDWFAVDRSFPEELVTVSKAVDHIDHIVKLIGIDYVGIGTDFDGGGGLEDCFDISQMGNITVELVRRGYTANEIKKIWGGNLTRVFKEVENAAV